MPTHTYSVVLRDVSWSDIGNAVNKVKELDSNDNIDLHIRHDTSGGILEDGTAYDTETSFRATYEYALGDGQTALEGFSQQLSQVPPLPDNASQLTDTIHQRG